MCIVLSISNTCINGEQNNLKKQNEKKKQTNKQQQHTLFANVWPRGLYQAESSMTIPYTH